MALLLVCLLALDAVVAMGKSAAQPTHHTEELLTDGTVATSLLSLAAQFALEVQTRSSCIVLFSHKQSSVFLFGLPQPSLLQSTNFTPSLQLYDTVLPELEQPDPLTFTRSQKWL